MRQVSNVLRRKNVDLVAVEKEAYKHRTMASLCRAININQDTLVKILKRNNKKEEVEKILHRFCKN